MRNFCQPHYRGSERLNGQPMATQHIQSNIHGCGSHIPFLPTLSLCVPLGSGPLTLGLTSRPLFSGSWLWVAPSEGLSLFGWTHCTSTTPLATVVLTANYPGPYVGIRHVPGFLPCLEAQVQPKGQVPRTTVESNSRVPVVLVSMPRSHTCYLQLHLSCEPPLAPEKPGLGL
jgi:hypothetical protein